MLQNIVPAIGAVVFLSLSTLAASATDEWSDEAAIHSADEVETRAALETSGAAYDETWSGVRIHFAKPPQWLNAGSHWDFGRARLTLSATDGKLLITDLRNDQVKWSTPAAGPGAILRFQTDSNLVLYNSAGQAIWTSNTYNVCQNDSPVGSPVLALQADSNFVVYCNYGPSVYKAKWATNTIF